MGASGSRSVPGRAVLAVVLALGVAGAAGCSGDGDPVPSPSPSAATSPAASPTPSVEAPIGPLGTGPRSAAAEVPATSAALLTDVRTGGHTGFARVVFDFEGDAAPGWTVAYEPGPFTADPSDLPLNVAGSAFLRVRMEPAAGYDQGTATATYTGPERVGGTSPVTEVVRQGDFEAVLSWVVGVDGERPFAVAWLQDPGRLVIDVSSS
jgi:hypothetical protein